MSKANAAPVSSSRCAHECAERAVPLAEFKEGCYLDALFGHRAHDWTPCVLHALLDVESAIIDAKDRHGRYLFVNQAFVNWCGISIERTAGRTDAELFTSKRAATMIARDAAVLASGQPETFEETLQQSDGPRSYLVHKFPIRNPREDVAFAVGSLRLDVTERKVIEQRLLEHSMEMRVATQIQESLLPSTMPQPAGFCIAAACVSAQETGGDFLDFVQLTDRRLGFVIGDASGHGIGAALLMAQSHAYLRAFSQTANSLEAILCGVNQALAAEMPAGHFVTMFLGALDPAGRKIDFANAGHLAGLLFDSKGALLRKLDSTGCPLGIDAAFAVPAGPSVAMNPSETLVLLTDGIIEAFPAVGVPYGCERLLATIRAHYGLAPSDLVRVVLDDVRAYVHGQPHDDCSIMIVRANATEP